MCFSVRGFGRALFIYAENKLKYLVYANKILYFFLFLIDISVFMWYNKGAKQTEY